MTARGGLAVCPIEYAHLGALARHCLEQFPGIGEIEALKGNEPARALYESLGFRTAEIQKGRMPGNEEFPVKVYVLRRG